MKKFVLLSIVLGILLTVSVCCYASQKKYKLVPYKPLTQSQCQQYKEALGLKHCPYNNDHLAGAALACGHKKNLPSVQDLQILAQDVYNKQTSETSIYGKRNDALLKDMGIFVNDSHIYYWIGEEANDGKGGYVRMFASKGSIPYYAPRDGSGYVSHALGKVNFGDTKYIPVKFWRNSNLSGLPNEDVLVTICYNFEENNNNKYSFLNEDK